MDVKSCGGILLKFHCLAIFGSQQKMQAFCISLVKGVCVCVCVPLTLKKQVCLKFSVRVAVVSYFCLQYISHRIHVCFFYLCMYQPNAGKYTNPMDPSWVFLSSLCAHHNNPRVCSCHRFFRQVLTGDMRILSPDAQSRGAGGAMWAEIFYYGWWKKSCISW